MSHRTKKAILARCVECESRIFFQETPEVGLTLLCPECDTKLEVVGLNPLVLDWGDDYFTDDDDKPYY